MATLLGVCIHWVYRKISERTEGRKVLSGVKAYLLSLPGTGHFCLQGKSSLFPCLGSLTPLGHFYTVMLGLRSCPRDGVAHKLEVVILWPRWGGAGVCTEEQSLVYSLSSAVVPANL